MSHLLDSYFEWAWRQPGCGVCYLVRLWEERWLWHLLYESVLDPSLRRDFARGPGLCPPHAHLLERVVQARELVGGDGVAAFYGGVVDEVLRRLEVLVTQRPAHPLIWPKAPRRGAEAALLPRPAGCLLCRQRLEALVVAGLAELLAAEGERADFARSPGLCAPHFARLWDQVEREDVRRFLLADQRRRLEQLHERLVQLQRKQRYDVHEAVTLAEARSWREAIWRFAGCALEGVLIRRGDAEPGPHASSAPPADQEQQERDQAEGH